MSRCFTLFAEPGNRLCFLSRFLRPVLQEGCLGIGKAGGRIYQIRVLPEEVPLPLFQLLPSRKLLADAERLGEDAVRADLHICREEGVPVKIRHAAALCAEDMVHRTHEEREIPGPVNQRGAAPGGRGRKRERGPAGGQQSGARAAPAVPGTGPEGTEAEPGRRKLPGRRNAAADLY